MSLMDTAKAIAKTAQCADPSICGDDCLCLRDARIARSIIIEECARVAESYFGGMSVAGVFYGPKVADAIRALKDKPHDSPRRLKGT